MKIDNTELASRIIHKILFSLDESTWGEDFPSAKENLKDYTQDMIEDVDKVLEQFS
jgi:hypothetical protein